MLALALLVLVLGLGLGACAPQMALTEMTPCPATGCSSNSAASAQWPPYEREVEALAVQELGCPAERLSYSRVGDGKLVEGCGKQALYLARCSDDGFRDCHPINQRRLAAQLTR
jgi:hypothetical protein